MRIPRERLLCLKWELGLCSSHSLLSLRRNPRISLGSDSKPIHMTQPFSSAVFYPRETQTGPHENLYTNMKCSLLASSPKLEAASLSLAGEKDKQRMYLCNGILQTTRGNEQTIVTCNEMNESQNNDAKVKKSQTKKDTIYKIPFI